MARYFLDVSYDGSNYFGWQIQPDQISVQEELNKALSTVLSETIETTGSGRTDTGVHARQNMVHFDSDNVPEGLPYHLNKVLPADIAINNMHQVADDAHARFDATARVYQYYLHFWKDPFLEKRSYHYVYGALDMDAMNQAATHLLTTKDMDSFSRGGTQTKTNECTVTHAQWVLGTGGHWMFEIRANRFLRGMVRGIVATLLRVGNGKLTGAEFEELLRSRDASKTDFAAPPHGLYLTQVRYPYIKQHG
jgi:tRNA pseudouridine38-40 synthase